VTPSVAVPKVYNARCNDVYIAYVQTAKIGLRECANFAKILIESYLLMNSTQIQLESI
jgi:hypothetical protein